MVFPFRKIMCAVDFDDSSFTAIDAAAQIARQNNATLILAHIVPIIIQSETISAYIGLEGLDKAARNQLTEIVKTRLDGIKCELSIHSGEPAQTILRIERKLEPDLLVLATHGRKGLSHFLLGSVAELILRGATCPVLTVRIPQQDKNTVQEWMTRNPETASEQDKLATVQAKMLNGDFRCLPVLKEGRLVGIITEREVREHLAQKDQIEVGQVMPDDIGETLTTVTPSTSLKEAARLMRELKLEALPVVEDEETLVGVITTSDILRAFAELA
jgi:nucleotide-binding universal stress UspA family protein/CBS domain-containing protein